MKIKKTLEIAQGILNLAEKEGWSEEELAKAIKLLHSEMKNYSLFVDPFLSTDETKL
ncbi:hypothetical protein [Bacillus methanolicus]|uniref:hypothetical protein n=1 Tax=Bacillus methanolicus TaxID=1471 RepID=UPI00200CE887|nr:hypothetical protein [Bacillus methanolicus]